MARFQELARIMGELPEVAEGEHPEQGDAWLRPFSRANLMRFGDKMPPTPPILAANTKDCTRMWACSAPGLTARSRSSSSTVRGALGWVQVSPCDRPISCTSSPETNIQSAESSNIPSSGFSDPRMVPFAVENVMFSAIRYPYRW